MLNAFLFFLHFSVAFAVVLAAGQLTIRFRQPRNYLLFAIYLCLASLEFFFLYVLTDSYLSWPHLFRIHTPFTFALGPLLYLFFRVILTEEGGLQRRDLLHFIPVVVAMIVLTPFYLQSAEAKKQAAISVVQLHQPGWADFFAFSSNVIVLIYLGVVALHFAPLWRLENLSKDVNGRLFFFLLIVAVAIAGLGVIVVIERDILFIRISAVAVGAILIFSYVIGQRYPQFFQSIQQTMAKEKYKRSLLGDVDLMQVQQRLNELMTEDQLFLNDDLSLAELAQKVDLNKHQLSEYLNARLNTSFFHYINGLRITEACKRLLENPETPILDIAYSVGFNSKSSFNSAFTRHTGKTPREYRQRSGST